MKDIIELKQKDLVLPVEYNPLNLDIDAWDDYLDYLCKNRNYQKEAIKTSVKYLVGGRYTDLKSIARASYKKNIDIQEMYKSEKDYLKEFDLFGHKLFANIDLATGTGKSYVMYAIAQIMLSLGFVDKVLVLCPTLTIEDGLTDKFISLSKDLTLTNLIPSSLKNRTNPTILNADSTVLNNSICIENIHAVYEKTGSSIKDSFLSKGDNVLVLNDESHHIFNKPTDNDSESKDLKKWADFLLNNDYNFKYILGFTGTAYQGNKSFLDVIYRYSIRQALEDGIIKNIEYIQDNSSFLTKEEKFQIIYQNHNKFKTLYSGTLKPLTILITKDTTYAEKLKNELIEYFYNLKIVENKQLEKNPDILKKDIQETILKITNDSPISDRTLLKTVDSSENKVEWIIGVAMLNEGWDVKNVFQIVPMEDKAFNSKLLISQVLGRGLRIPNGVVNPKVTVLNHHAWGNNIKKLVDEVLELETRIQIGQSTLRTNYNFDVYNIDYTREPIEIDKKESEDKKSFDYSKMISDGIYLESQSIIKTINLDFEDIKGNQESKSYQVQSLAWTIDEVLDRIYQDFRMREWEGIILKINDNHYSKQNLPPRETIAKIIHKSLESRGITDTLITDKNVQKILASFSTIMRRNSKKIEYKQVYDSPIQISTNSMKQESFGISNFRKTEYCLFHTENYEDESLNDAQKSILKEFINSEDFLKSSTKLVNSNLFKTCSNFVVTTSLPEKKFVEELIKKDNASIISSWVKSKNRGFYSINYSMKSGSNESRNREYKIQGFNPDFFIKVTQENMTYILVNEIKADKDDSAENKAKYKYAKQHFEILNQKLKDAEIMQTYIFHMLSPEGYETYFSELKKAIIGTGKFLQSQAFFRCDLERLLEEKN